MQVSASEGVANHTATGARSGALARRGCRRGRCSKGAGRCRGRTPRLHAAMTPAGAETFRAGEGCTVLAGGGDRVRVLRVNRAHGQEEPRDQGEGQQRFAHQIPLLMNDARPQYQPWGMLCAIDLCLARANSSAGVGGSGPQIQSRSAASRT